MIQALHNSNFFSDPLTLMTRHVMERGGIPGDLPARVVIKAQPHVFVRALAEELVEPRKATLRTSLDNRFLDVVLVLTRRSDPSTRPAAVRVIDRASAAFHL